MVISIDNSKAKKSSLVSESSIDSHPPRRTKIFIRPINSLERDVEDT